jgi:hypothetical protein
MNCVPSHRRQGQRQGLVSIAEFDRGPRSAAGNEHLAESLEHAGQLQGESSAPGALHGVSSWPWHIGQFYLDDMDDDVTLTALRLLVKDLLLLFEAVNEGVINVLGTGSVRVLVLACSHLTQV